MDNQFLHLEHDGKLLLVDLGGNGPAIPKMGRSLSEDGSTIRLPTPEEVSAMGISWKLRRVNRIRLDSKDYIVNYGIPEIPGLRIGLGKTRRLATAQLIHWPGSLSIGLYTG